MVTRMIILGALARGASALVGFPEALLKQLSEDKKNKAHMNPPDCDTTFVEQEHTAQAATDDLVAAGWEVTDGHMIFTSAHSFGNNPSSVYGLFFFHDFPLFQMGEMDAIMWLGCTPPDLEYFSARSYVFSKSARTQDPIKSEVVEFASLGDAMNNLRFNSTGGSRSPDNQNRSSAIIISGNQPSAGALADALEANGFPRAAVNYDWMPPSILNMDSPHTPFDLNLVPESYQFLFRVSLFRDAAAGERYANSAFPLRMFKAPSGIPEDLIPVPTQLARGTGTNEEAWRGGLENLTTSSESFWAAKGCANARTVDLYPIDIEGLLDCVPNIKQCGGDNRDAAYFSDYDASYTLQPEGNASFLLVTGVNHNASGKATYANVVVETAPPGDGVFNATCNGRIGVDSTVSGLPVWM